MTASVIAVIAVVVGIAWLAVLGVQAVRNRRSEEIAPNLSPGITNAELETRRLETGQKAAIAFSAFLAISLPLYFLGEQDRQDAFVEEFAAESVARGEHIVEEFACFSCHGPGGSGGVAQYVEKRSGVTVQWVAPSIDDVFFRYDESEINFWVTFGRGNTPMPAWGLPGGGPLNDAQVVDVVNYLRTIQISQAAALEELDPAIDSQLGDLAAAEDSVAAAILDQQQTIADIESAPEQFAEFDPLVVRADLVFEDAGEGIDTDADGVSDNAEVELSAISQEAYDIFKVVDALAMDPAVADAEIADDTISQLEAAVTRDPILETNLAVVELALAEGAVDPSVGLTDAAAESLNEIADSASEIGATGLPEVTDLDSATEMVADLLEASAEEGADPELATLAGEAQTAVDDGSDPDGDEISSGAEAAVTSQMADAATKTIPPQVASVITLDPANPASVGGEPDLRTAGAFVGNLGSLQVNLRVTTENQDKLLENETGGLEFLLEAQETMLWDIDFDGVAAGMGSSVEDAMRAVGIFQANCARCHTAGFSAGLPFSQEIGSGGFGPALWDGRPVVQFGDATELPEDDLLLQFLVRGSEEETPYGLNGFGSGRMPGFGAILSAEDIQLLATFLRGGSLNGKE
ncbi:MAG TPA: c-type cytochrome [Acidimicrobiia bacterium]